ncbi:MAG: DJ-1/PfpI family protein, partial [Acidobacteriota bacterium]
MNTAYSPLYSRALTLLVVAALLVLVSGCYRLSMVEPDDSPAPSDDATAAAASPPTGSPPTGSGSTASAATVDPDSNVPWTRVAPAEPLPDDRPQRAGFLLVDGVYNSELMAPYDLFQHSIFHVQPGIEVFTVSPDGRPITTFEGLVITPHHSFDDVPAIDILVVPSAEHSMGTDLENAPMIDWVRDVGGAARYVMSLCDGAFVLAAAGLLEAHAATTFPSDQDAFAAMFPQVDLRRGVNLVHDRRMITSEGGARSYDPAMYLLDLLYGPEVTR